ncbi:FliM/FliN family flagellar motor switch protein [Bryobacter aggregatus]|uniref:FliM/FliN family flagellar motor switch protein n=1 Tax=Bryobacter aggregatus TaxID=360054 RepID=UPI0004E0EF5D|nr:FliM/FliN family flagellar motor switch protein [Bryobacter aggregatus]
MGLMKHFDHFLDMPLTVEAVLDRKTMTILDILSLEEGSVIKLNRSAGENIDIMIGGSSVAFAEVVIIEESMGVRVTDLTTDN